MIRISVFALVVSGLATSAAAAAQGDPRLFTAADVFELEWADEPQVSPDGSQAVYVRQSNDVMADRTVSQVWIADLDGTRHEPLLADGSSFRSTMECSWAKRKRAVALRRCRRAWLRRAPPL